MRTHRHTTAPPRLLWPWWLLACAEHATGPGAGEGVPGLGDATVVGAAAGTASASGPNSADDRCRSQCELAGRCEEIPLESFMTFAETASDWSGICASSFGDGAFPFVIEGSCADGKRVLATGGGFTTERRYFDDSGRFVALTTSTDVIDPVCKGKGYWPERVQCDRGKVTLVHCGTIYEVGDPL